MPVRKVGVANPVAPFDIARSRIELESGGLSLQFQDDLLGFRSLAFHAQDHRSSLGQAYVHLGVKRTENAPEIDAGSKSLQEAHVGDSDPAIRVGNPEERFAPALG